MKDEYSVLQEMKEISPDHVPELYYFDKYGKFYVTERYGSNEHRNIDSIPEDLITSLENTILDFHKHGVAHGDLKGNILFETDKH
jgi:tRNA A-37 threonylcarbamoyl transferase component Bud32